MTLSNADHGGDIFQFSSLKREKILDFSININPLGLSTEGLSALKDNGEQVILRYPDSQCRDMTAALSRRYEVPMDYISCGNGATELMYTLMRILKPRAAFVPAPGFSEYKNSASSAGAEIIPYFLDRENKFHISSSFLNSKIPADSVIYAGNPNNPDGNHMAEEDFAVLLQMAEKSGSFLVIDESFVDFLPDSCSYRKLVSAHSHLIIISSLTKFFAIPGLRAGYMLADPDLTEIMKEKLIPWNVNGLAQLYMCHAAGDFSYIAHSKSFVKEERKRFTGTLSSFKDFIIYPGEANFILVHLAGDLKSGSKLQNLLTPYDIMIRNCANFDALDDSWIRLAVRTREQDDKLIEVLHKVGLK